MPLRCPDYYVSDLHNDSCKECKRLNEEYLKQKRLTRQQVLKGEGVKR